MKEVLKEKIGIAAANLIEPGMTVGLGTGSTARYFIESLAKRCREGLQILAVASSRASHAMARQLQIPLANIDEITSLDICVDGADEIDPQKRLIKGGGGALAREKIIASMSREMIVIADESKLVPLLGRGKLPVEILPFAHRATLHKLTQLSRAAALRKSAQGQLYTTDNGNYIVDISFSEPLKEPEKTDEALLHLPGVVDTGFFFHLAGRLVIGFRDGQVIIRD